MNKILRFSAIFCMLILIASNFPLAFASNGNKTPKPHEIFFQNPWRKVEVLGGGILRSGSEELLGKGDLLVYLTLTPDGFPKVRQYAQIGPVRELDDGQYGALAVTTAADLLSLANTPGVTSVKVKPKPAVPKMKGKAELSSRDLPIGNTYKLREVLGANLALSKFGVTGKDIRIGIVDTGVDYAHPDLRDSLVYVKKGEVREPLVLDADESQVLLLSSFKANASGYIGTNGSIVTVYSPFPLTYNVRVDYKVGGIVSMSGNYRFGVTREFYLGNNFQILRLGVLLTDSEKRGEYTTAYVDLDNDKDFTNEAPITYNGDRVASGDLNKDGIIDISAGILGGFFYDALQWFEFPSSVLPGWDKKGEYLSIFYDFFGHGTSVAGVAASRGKATYKIPSLGNLTLPGMAPGAKIVAVKGLWLGMVEIGMLWLAGFDVGNGRLSYSGSTRADLINISWGLPNPLYDVFGVGYDFETTFINGLVIPSYLDSRYPGMPIIVAGGNAGFGYGTVSSPAVASFAITVGASTSTHVFANFTGYSSLGSFDGVTSWSSRGPTLLGEPKPDLVAPGMYAAAITHVLDEGWGWFGGTSLSAAVTSGVTALVIDSLGKKVDPVEVKSILQASAKDLGYGSLQQGSGRIDAYRAVLLAKRLGGEKSEGPELLRISTSESNRNLKEVLTESWRLQWAGTIRGYFFFGQRIETRFPSRMPDIEKLRTGSLFLGRVDEGTSKEFTLYLQNPQDHEVEISQVRAVKYSAISKNQTYVIADTAKGGIVDIPLSRDAFKGADLTKISLHMTFEGFDPGFFYVWARKPVLYVFDWRDANGNGKPEDEELVLLDRSTLAGITQEVTLGFPSLLFTPRSKPLLRLQVEKASQYFRDLVVPLSLVVTNYVRSPDPAIVLTPEVGKLGKNQSLEIPGLVTSPQTDLPGVREGLIEFSFKGPSGLFKQVMPYSYTVVTKAPGKLTPPSSRESTLYDLGAFRGAVNWSGEFVSGDWRMYTVKVTDPNAFALEVSFEWEDRLMSLDIITLGPDGQYAGYIFGDGIGLSFLYLGTGAFVWHQTAKDGDPVGMRAVTFPQTSYTFFEYPYRFNGTGVFTILVHEVLNGGFRVSEPAKGEVRVLSAQPRGKDMSLRPGSSLPVDVAIKIPYEIKVSPDSPFFYDFSLELFAFSTNPTGVAPRVRDLTQPFKEGEPISTTLTNLRIFAPRYAGRGTQILVAAFIPVIPELRTYYIFMGEIRELLYSPVYVFQDWFLVRVG